MKYIFFIILAALAFKKLSACENERFDLRQYCLDGFESTKEKMDAANDAQDFFYNKGRCYTYYEIMRILDDFDINNQFEK